MRCRHTSTAHSILGQMVIQAVNIVREKDVVLSPCINICVIDEETGFCAGCQRTIEEITGWADRNSTAKREILQKLTDRRAWLKVRNPTVNGLRNACNPHE